MTFYRSSLYNYTDWNRIETKINEIWAELDALGSGIPAITSKTDWDEYDFPFVEELDRIKGNIMILVQYGFVPYDLLTFEYDKIYFDYIEANKLELNLERVESAIDRAEIRHSGEGYSGDTIWL